MWSWARQRYLQYKDDVRKRTREDDDNYEPDGKEDSDHEDGAPLQDKVHGLRPRPKKARKN
jgi:hypothetical protein